MAKRPSEVDEFLKTVPSEWRPVVAELRKLVLRVAPDAREALRYGMPSYLKDEQDFIYIMPTKDHVNLGFVNGVKLADPHGVLEGTGKDNRHVKVWSVKDTRSRALAELIKEALRIRETSDEGPVGR